MQRYLFGIAKRTFSLTGNNVRRFATVGSGLRPQTEKRHGTITIAVKKPDFKYLDGIVFMRDAEGSVWRFPETDCEPLSLARIERRLKIAKESQVLIDEKGVEAKIVSMKVDSELMKLVMVGNNQAIEVGLDDELIKRMIGSPRLWLPRDFTSGSRTVRRISDTARFPDRKDDSDHSGFSGFVFIFSIVIFLFTVIAACIDIITWCVENWKNNTEIW